MTGDERGSVTLIVAASLAFAAIIGAFGADLTRAIAGRGRAQAAADAAALAAAQELVVSSGRPLEEVAAEYAERGGARLESCDCDPSANEVVVSVVMDVALPLLGQVRTVRARARAVVEAPAGTQGLRAWFVARLGCLLGGVPESRWCLGSGREPNRLGCTQNGRVLLLRPGARCTNAAWPRTLRSHRTPHFARRIRLRRGVG